MSKYTGQISKLISNLDSPISYTLPIGENKVPLNNLIGKTLTFKFNGEIRCVECDVKIKKTFMQGYCYPCFISSPKTSECILKPELCRAHEGDSRDMEWSEEHCLKEHFVYLSLTAGAKIGVTRATQIPTRWIDQGAVQALKFAKTSNRYEAGCIEVQMKNHISDRTAWQRMLKNEIDDSIDLYALKNELMGFISDQYKDFILNNQPMAQLIENHNIQLIEMKNDNIILFNNLSITPFEVPHRNELSETVGFKIKSLNKSVIYLPDIDDWDSWTVNLEQLIIDNNILFLDGTFYIKSEIQLRDVSNIPHPEIIDTMEKLSNLSSRYKKRVHFIHLNHTNDVLRKKSDAYNNVIDNNFSLAKENQMFEI